MIRVVVADDSATARELLRSVLQMGNGIEVVAEATNGAEAVELVERHRPDLVVMDVHMPVADGLEATNQIMRRVPTPIIIVSSVRQPDVDLSLSATQAGALLALAKPDGPGAPGFAAAAAELRAMCHAMAQVKVVRHWSGHADNERPRAADAVRGRRHDAVPDLIAIGTSTGGPAALRSILLELPRTFPVPIAVVQHIAHGFTAGLADWLDNGCPLRVKVAEPDELMLPGIVYVAPDAMHLGISRDCRAKLDAGPPIGGFRPSATYLFRSAADALAERLVAVVLTGMGTDGADGLVQAQERGAYVLAQDEPTSVVYGMAQEAVRRRAVNSVAPLGEIPERLTRLCRGAANGR